MKVIRYAALALIPILCLAAQRPAALADDDLQEAVPDDIHAAAEGQPARHAAAEGQTDGHAAAEGQPARHAAAAGRTARHRHAAAEGQPVDHAAAEGQPGGRAAAPAQTAESGKPTAKGLSVDPATADRIFQNVMENGVSGDAFDGPGFVLYHQESEVESITVNAVAREGAEALYQDKSRDHFRGLVVVHTFRTPGCPGDAEKDGRLYTDSWIFDMDLAGTVYEGGHHAFCTSGAGRSAKRVESSKASKIDGGLSSPGSQKEFAKLAARLPHLEKKGVPFWADERAK
jgi:hypothetical protein